MATKMRVGDRFPNARPPDHQNQARLETTDGPSGRAARDVQEVS